MRKLAVFFPGIGYTCDKPLLFYAEKLAIKSGYEIKRISYSLPGDRKIRGDKERLRKRSGFFIPVRRIAFRTQILANTMRSYLYQRA